MQIVFEAKNLTKRFGEKVVLDSIDLTLTGPAIIGLLGKNGCGKTTLIRHIVGQFLPSDGGALTFGRNVAELDHDELVSLGYVSQEIQLLNWMNVRQHFEYVASFYPSWDMGRQDKLVAELELDLDAMVGELSSGNLQKLAIILAVCHHPRLVVLDEPVSDLDPIARSNLLKFLLDLLIEDDATILVSSHVLRDVEKVVNHVVCLDEGRVVADAALDDLKEHYAEWRVWSADGTLPQRFDEPYVLVQETDGADGRIVVRDALSVVDEFQKKYGCEISSRPLNLEEMFPLMLEKRG